MSFTFTSSGAIIRRAGAGVNSTFASSGAFLTEISDAAEGFINARARQDLIGQYSSISGAGQFLLKDIATNIAAKRLIEIDMSGYRSLAEAQTMLDVLDNEAENGLKLLENKDTTQFWGITT